MSNIKFVDNSVKVMDAMDNAINAWLEEAAGELESQAKRNSPVDTGQLKNSWNHKVDSSAQKATIGSGIENAIWNEFGTGQYALHGGRTTPWRYQDARGQWHTTHGKRPQRSLHYAFETKRASVQKALEEKLKGLGK